MTAIVIGANRDGVVVSIDGAQTAIGAATAKLPTDKLFTIGDVAIAASGLGEARATYEGSEWTYDAREFMAEVADGYSEGTVEEISDAIAQKAHRIFAPLGGRNLEKITGKMYWAVAGFEDGSPVVREVFICRDGEDVSKRVGRRGLGASGLLCVGDGFDISRALSKAQQRQPRLFEMPVDFQRLARGCGLMIHIEGETNSSIGPPIKQALITETGIAHQTWTDT